MTHHHGPVVLSVDDEPSILALREMVLSSAGYEVLSATSGRDGLELFRSNDVQLVLLDYLMPGMNGAAVAAEMRRTRPQVPILIVSACLNLPASALVDVDGFIEKGVSVPALLAAIADTLGGLRKHASTTQDALHPLSLRNPA